MAMNCIEKMYKEIEEILAKEKLEYAKLQVPVKEIKSGFSSFNNDEDDKMAQVDYLSSAIYDENIAKKIYLDQSRATDFLAFIFKKYVCLNSISQNVDKFIQSIPNRAQQSEDLVELLNSLINEFAQIVGESEEFLSFFKSSYNVLYKDENGYFAVILNGKYSDVKRPQGLLHNQLRKVLKEIMDEYTAEFVGKVMTEKERNAFLNSVKANINKFDANMQCDQMQKLVEDMLYDSVKNKGVKRKDFEEYLEEKGIRLIKQGNFYYKTKDYNAYGEYKKIEFRY